METILDLWKQVEKLPNAKESFASIMPDLQLRIKESLKPFGQPPDVATYGSRISEALEAELLKFQIDRGFQYPGLMALGMNSFFSKAH